MAKTLFALGGVDVTPPRIDEAAIVIIDAQRDYVDGLLPLAGVQEALSKIAKLLEIARKAGAPVVHVQHRGNAGGGLFDPQGRGFTFADEASPVDGEAIVEKTMPNGFTRTTLGEELEKIGRKNLIIAGFMTHNCVSATARAALDLGYRTTVLADASGTRDLPDALGTGVIAAADIHRIELAGLADRTAIVCSLADLEAGSHA